MPSHLKYRVYHPLKLDLDELRQDTFISEPSSQPSVQLNGASVAVIGLSIGVGPLAVLVSQLLDQPNVKPAPGLPIGPARGLPHQASMSPPADVDVGEKWLNALLVQVNARRGARRRLERVEGEEIVHLVDVAVGPSAAVAGQARPALARCGRNSRNRRNKAHFIGTSELGRSATNLPT